MTHTNKVQDIFEGVYRWTIDTVNFSIRHSEGGLNQEITGTGKAPLLSPSEATEAITQLISSCIPEKDMVERDGVVGESLRAGENYMIDTITTNLKEKGIKI